MYMCLCLMFGYICIYILYTDGFIVWLFGCYGWIIKLSSCELYIKFLYFLFFMFNVRINYRWKGGGEEAILKYYLNCLVGI